MIRNIHNPALRAARFPLHPRPLEDELLSSWLIRIAYRHKTDPVSFANLYLPDWKFILWSRDFDTTADWKLLEALSYKSRQSIEALYSLTLRSYEGFLAEELTDKTRNLLVQPLVNYSHTKVGYGLRYCPLCLREDEKPYFRRKWRLSFSTACVKHSCFLLDRCTACSTPLTLSKLHDDRPVFHCYRCGHEYAKSETEPVDGGSYGLEAIASLHRILDHGFFHTGDMWTYSFAFFSVLKQLVKVAYWWGKTEGFLDHEVMTGKIAYLSGRPRLNLIENIPLKEQYLLFSGLMRLFEDFPSRLIRFCETNKVRKTDLTKDMHSVPFWYSNVAERFNGEYCAISPEEVSSVITYLKDRRIPISAAKVSRLVGRGIDFRKRKDLRVLFSNGQC